MRSREKAGVQSMNQGHKYWVENGVMGINVPKYSLLSSKDEKLKFEAGQVRVTTGDLGTEIKWTVLSPCLSSIFAVIEWLDAAKAPFVLRFYISGWFEEFYQTAPEVTRRLEDIITRGDRHLTKKTFVQQVDPVVAHLTPLLSDCLSSQISPEDYAVECSYEEVSQQFIVDKVGAKSPISKFYGTFLSSFPCQPIGSYNDTVNEAYRHVLDTGKPRYDHVMAAFRLPDNQVHWVPYHRLILPKLAIGAKHTVSVISEISRISFNVI